MLGRTPAVHVCVCVGWVGWGWGANPGGACAAGTRLALCSDEDVVGLDVAVHNAQRVQPVQGCKGGGRQGDVRACVLQRQLGPAGLLSSTEGAATRCDGANAPCSGQGRALQGKTQAVQGRGSPPWSSCTYDQSLLCSSPMNSFFITALMVASERLSSSQLSARLPSMMRARQSCGRRSSPGRKRA